MDQEMTGQIVGWVIIALALLAMAWCVKMIWCGPKDHGMIEFDPTPDGGVLYRHQPTTEPEWTDADYEPLFAEPKVKCTCDGWPDRNCPVHHGYWER